MKRLCIYVVYDKQNIINRYIGEVLKELKKYVDDIYVVCNFNSIIKGEEIIKPYAKSIVFRENVGFDAGAYKDVMNYYITWDVIREYNELILTNDTYFAPLFSFDEMINTMTLANCDYWGITKHPAGRMEEIGDYNEHIQSYFLCFKQKIIQDSKFAEFWENYNYCDNKEQTIAYFELGINEYLKKIGFTGLAYMDIMDYDFNFSGNPYSLNAYELIKYFKIPLIKKTNFYGKNRGLVNTMKAMDYIEHYCDYDISLINDYIKEYKEKGLLGPYYDLNKLEMFVKTHDRIFIYGAGNWGQITSDYLLSRGLSYEDYIVTKSNRENELEFKSVIFGEKDGIIIAQENKDVCDEIMDNIKKVVSESQIFIPCYP